ncbi:hypothetical protein CCHOA_09485 [Corynebacterium choanae]|uniref:Uncharacterized protein n=1 Tax=Corynebacterium choanae TaxID=1862358 RepID=A0A3G6JC78_9CORY|nr:hypothetical protein CCHOA_09485 [Corynebacterium choanae]
MISCGMLSFPKRPQNNRLPFVHWQWLNVLRTMGHTADYAHRRLRLLGGAGTLTSVREDDKP